MYEYETSENIIKDFEEFKSNELETDLQKLIDLYIMSIYYDIVDYSTGEETPEEVAEKIENIIKKYYIENKEIILKCWNGIHGCESFIIEMWQYNFKNINEAGAFYKEIWGNCWAEDENGKILQRF